MRKSKVDNSIRDAFLERIKKPGCSAMAGRTRFATMKGWVIRIEPEVRLKHQVTLKNAV